MATPPAGGDTGENVAFSRTAGSVFSKPMQFGPIRRQPARRMRSTSAASRARPSSPHSLKPALITQIARTSLADAVVDGCQHLIRRDDDHREIDRSGDVVRFEGRRGSRRSAAHVGWTATTVPVKPEATRLCRISEPILPRSRLAPMTATVRGSKNAFIDAVAAARERAAALSAKASVVDSDRVDVVDAMLDPCGHGEAGVAKDVEHASVVAEHVGIEGVDALLARDGREPLEQPRADAVALQGVGHGERHFGAIPMLRHRDRSRRRRRCGRRASTTRRFPGFRLRLRAPGLAMR